MISDVPQTDWLPEPDVLENKLCEVEEAKGSALSDYEHQVVLKTHVVEAKTREFGSLSSNSGSLETARKLARLYFNEHWEQPDSFSQETVQFSETEEEVVSV